MSHFVDPSMKGQLRTVIRDGQPQWQLCCPGCGVWADLDDDQLHGRVSVDHSAGSDDQGLASDAGCGYHESRDWFTEAALGGPE